MAKTTLTDYKTGKQMTILHDSNFLPAFGEDGLQYFILTNLLDYGVPRTDCTVLDLNHGIGIKPITHPAFGIKEPMQFPLDKEAFSKAQSIEEYAGIIKNRNLF